MSQMPGFLCCRVCGKLFTLDRLVVGAGIGFEFVPTESRGNFIVCNGYPATLMSECRRKLETEINRLVREEGYKGFYPFGPT